MTDKNTNARFDLIIGSLSMSNLTANELHDVLKNLTSMDWETEIRPFCKRCDRLQKASARKGAIRAYKQ